MLNVWNGPNAGGGEGDIKHQWWRAFLRGEGVIGLATCLHQPVEIVMARIPPFSVNLARPMINMGPVAYRVLGSLLAVAMALNRAAISALSTAFAMPRASGK